MIKELKELVSEKFVENLGNAIKKIYKSFRADKFKENVLETPFLDFPLKQRIRRITDCLTKFLPLNYKEAVSILQKIHHKFTGLPGLVFPDFVTQNGVSSENFIISMLALENFTIYSSSEFAIRSFILFDQEKTLKWVKKWSKDPRENVRRLSSEGIRPRLPWREHIVSFREDPGPVLEILENLMDDPSLFVRKSVGNNLNDISKDHRDLFYDFAKKWLGYSESADWILKKGARTLLKEKDKEILKLFGYRPTSAGRKKTIETINFSVTPERIKIGEKTELFYEIESKKEGLVRLEYILRYPTKGGKHGEKIFFLTEKNLSPKEILKGKRLLTFKDMTIRKQVPGIQELTLIANGEILGKITLQLLKRSNKENS
ncbi:MAG: DNA alkylation repair protein [Deltaproteobacteria bacterium]|jgi:3-methyladenine DNA glycosylase AlkC|nr:DNA alkylation repair protein [Deltaproteobacteria bacterium]